jgi:hypothetical protein
MVSMKYLIPPYLQDGKIIPAKIVNDLPNEMKWNMKKDVIQDYARRRAQLQQSFYDNLRDEDRYYNQKLLEIEIRKDL